MTAETWLEKVRWESKTKSRLWAEAKGETETSLLRASTGWCWYILLRWGRTHNNRNWRTVCYELWSLRTLSLVYPCFRQEAQLSQRDHAMLCITAYFAKSLSVIQDHGKCHHSIDHIWLTINIPLQGLTISCIICEIKRDIGRISWFFIPIGPYIRPPPPLGGPRRNTAIPFVILVPKNQNGVANRRCKKFDDMFSRFDRTEYRRARDGQTDRRWDGHLVTA